MSIRFLEPARAEFAEAAAYLNGQKPGLGDEFVREVRAGIDSVLAMPETWPVVRGDVRRYLIRRFPYAILYAIVSDDEIVVIAVAHGRRRPGYWSDRLREFEGNAG